MLHYNEEIQDLCYEPLTITAIISSEPFYFVASLLHRLFNLDLIASPPFCLFDTKSQTYYNNDAYSYFSEVDRLLFCFVDITQHKNKRNHRLNTYMLAIIGRDCKDITSKISHKLKEYSAFNSTILYYCQGYFDNALSEQETTTDTEQKESYEQGSLFDFESDNSYERIKKKRNKVKSSHNELQLLMLNFRQDIDCNIYNIITKLTR